MPHGTPGSPERATRPPDDCSMSVKRAGARYRTLMITILPKNRVATVEGMGASSAKAILIRMVNDIDTRNASLPVARSRITRQRTGTCTHPFNSRASAWLSLDETLASRYSRTAHKEGVATYVYVRTWGGGRSTQVPGKSGASKNHELRCFPFLFFVQSAERCGSRGAGERRDVRNHRQAEQGLDRQGMPHALPRGAVWLASRDAAVLSPDYVATAAVVIRSSCCRHLIRSSRYSSSSEFLLRKCRHHDNIVVF